MADLVAQRDALAAKVSDLATLASKYPEYAADHQAAVGKLSDVRQRIFELRPLDSKLRISERTLANKRRALAKAKQSRAEAQAEADKHLSKVKEADASISTISGEIVGLEKELSNLGKFGLGPGGAGDGDFIGFDILRDQLQRAAERASRYGGIDEHASSVLDTMLLGLSAAQTREETARVSKRPIGEVAPDSNAYPQHWDVDDDSKEDKFMDAVMEAEGDNVELLLGDAPLGQDGAGAGDCIGAAVDRRSALRAIITSSIRRERQRAEPYPTGTPGTPTCGPSRG